MRSSSWMTRPPMCDRDIETNSSKNGEASVLSIDVKRNGMPTDPTLEKF